MLIGVDLGGTNIRAGLVDEGVITTINQALITDKNSAQGTIAQLISTIAPLINQNVKGIGLGVPSVVDIEKGIVYNVVNIPSWKKVELKQILETEFKLPVRINNDVNCFAIGEHKYGLAKSMTSFVALALGTGLGAGIIVNNALYAGDNCGAGEIGYLPYLDKDFESYTSSSFFETIFSTTAFKAHDAAIKGDLHALDIWTEYGHHLGNVIKAVLYTYDPEAVILGGSISKAFNFFEASMKNTMSDFIYPETIKKVKILSSTTENIAILGAAALLNNH